MTITSFDFERRRHDTYSDIITITDPDNNDAVVDVTGFVFRLTVDTLKKPTDALTKVYQLTGVALDAVNGKVEFAPSDVQSDQTPGTYYYDIQMVDGAARRRTIMAGKYKYVQDITKDS